MRGFWRTVIAMVKDLQQEHLNHHQGSPTGASKSSSTEMCI